MDDEQKQLEAQKEQLAQLFKDMDEDVVADMIGETYDMATLMPALIKHNCYEPIVSQLMACLRKDIGLVSQIRRLVNEGE